MNKRELEDAIRDEIAEWPGASVDFVKPTGTGHPKAKLRFGELVMSKPYASTPGDAYRGLHNCLGEVRRALKQMGATRDKPEPSKADTEKRYSKPNEGREKRPDPIKVQPVKPKPDVADQIVAQGGATEEQAIKARVTRDAAVVALSEQDVEDDNEAEQTRRIAALQAQVDAIEDGIYFGLPDVVYHAVPRLSSSGLQKLCISAATFWKGSWLDPDKAELDEEATAAQVLGKAYHVARLEPERFHATYVRALSKAEMPKGTLFTGADMGKALEKMLEKKSGSVEEQAQRLIDAGYEGTVWHIEMAKWEAARAGRIPLSAEKFDDIVRDMDRIKESEDIHELLSGGMAEVSIFYTDRHGLKMKIRPDYLTPEWWDDFKTFENSKGKELEKALVDAIQYNRYHVQAVTYRDGIEAVRVGQLQIKGEATDEQRALIAAIQMRPDDLACHYIFQEKGGVPNLIDMEFDFYDVPIQTRINNAGATDEQVAAAERATRRKSELHRRAIMDIDGAKRRFVTYSQIYDPGQPWALVENRMSSSNMSFSQGWLEGKF